MKKFDLHWMSNREWFYFTKKGAILKTDAPQEAQESFQRYIGQTKNSRILLPNEIYMPHSEDELPNVTGNRQIILK